MVTNAVAHAYFGRPWGIEHDAVQVRPPVGRPCVQCCEPIGDHDRGMITDTLRIQGGVLTTVAMPVHMECAVRCAVGGIAPLVGVAAGPWKGTYREEARQVLAELNRIRHNHHLGPL